MQLLGCLFMLLFMGFFLVLAFGMSVLNVVLRLFGINSPRTPFRDEEAAPAEPTESAEPKRVFSDDEGEYVDFEEVK